MSDELNSYSKKHSGRWGTGKHELTKPSANASFPAPNHYQRTELKPLKQSTHPFNNSSIWIWFRPQKTLPTPGPGRYNPFGGKPRRLSRLKIKTKLTDKSPEADALHIEDKK